MYNNGKITINYTNFATTCVHNKLCVVEKNCASMNVHNSTTHNSSRVQIVTKVMRLVY